MASDKSHYIENNFIILLDTDKLADEINAIPARRAEFDKMEKKCRKATQNVADAYVKEARRIMHGVPVPYCNMSGYVGIMNSPEILVKVPETVPVVNIKNIPVDIFGDGTKTLLSFGTVLKNIDGKGNRPIPMLTEGIETKGLYEYIRYIKDTERIRFSAKSISVPLFNSLPWKDQATEIQVVVNKHLLRAEREVRSWLEELEQYADPNGLFGAML